MGKLSIMELFVGIAINVFFALAIKTTLSVKVTSIIEILFIYLVVYIFEYGLKMQNETKGKIYSE